jgi:hypothetical protein
MAVKPAKTTTPPDLVAQSAATDIATNAIGPGLNIEDMIADQLLDDIDWQKVRAAIIRKAPSRLFKWFQSQLLPTDGDRMITNEIEAMAICEGANDD